MSLRSWIGIALNMRLNTRVLCVVIGVMASCSVLEDRGPCPCKVELEMEEEGAGLLVYSFWAESGEVLASETITKDQGPLKTKIYVDKGLNVLCSVWIPGGQAVGEHSVTIPYGTQADSLYAMVGKLDCREETAECKVKVHKNFATLSIVFKNVKPGTNFDYYPEVCADTYGIELPSLTPLKGEFRFTPPMEGNRAECRLPRQCSNELSLQLLRSSDGGKEYELPLGVELEEAGYDWTAEDLADVEVVVDYLRLEPGFEVEPWEEIVIDEINY